MTTHSSTHEDIARGAREIWDIRGNPSGLDLAIWLEAEQQLDADSCARQSHGSAESSPVSDLVGLVAVAGSGGAALTEPDANGSSAGDSPGDGTPASSPDAIVATAAVRKNAARAPQHRHGKNAPKPASPESGKPLWDKPHSS